MKKQPLNEAPPANEITPALVAFVAQKGLKWGWVAKKLGVSFTYLSRVRHGHVRPSESLRARMHQMIYG